MTENMYKELLIEVYEALIWCSGSGDFCEGGRARIGWERTVIPLLDKIGDLVNVNIDDVLETQDAKIKELEKQKAALIEDAERLLSAIHTYVDHHCSGMCGSDNAEKSMGIPTHTEANECVGKAIEQHESLMREVKDD